MRFLETVEVQNNLKLIARDRGKIVARREGHNIWLDIGREYLAALIALTSYGPDTPERNDRIKYMGFGVGGTRQVAPGIANTAPISVAYPGTNVQTDLDPTVTRLERPVRVSGTTTSPSSPYSATDVWLGTIQAPPIHTTTSQVTFRRLFTQTEISYATFLSVPLSEVGLYTSLAVPIGRPYNTPVAYDTFDTISKTGAFEIEVDWTVRF
jgi:hypothetical protein